MLVAAAVCPCPPLLVPEVAQGAAPELEPLRAACDEAVRALAEAKPDLVVVVGPGERDAVHEAGATGSFRGHGVPLDVTLGEPDPRGGGAHTSLPLSLAVGAWLLARSPWGGPVRAFEAATTGDSATRRAHGAEVAGWADRVALLVMGDGSARRDLKAPGYLDERAAPLDARISAALASGDREGFLAGLDEETARDLMVSGRPAWQVLTGANASTGDGPVRHRLLHDDAPYGVGYFVASWT
ncbi:class III extradiol dioxygenase subunit B-like domain-containing protein [Streptomyces sp. NPDC002734]|uniref:class III extradiol dioxygenase subunit B-like domain-containing protein n=1 Tax=Streptomyces sp. NPDC002734 TaxID=3154426 RepID=UPI00332D0E6D